MTKEVLIEVLAKAGQEFLADSAQLQAAIAKACYENAWFTPDSCKKALDYWGQQLTIERLQEFSANYAFAKEAKKVGIIMAGNIPMVGFHDLVVCLLSGHTAMIKPSSEDKALMNFATALLIEIEPDLAQRIQLIERFDSAMDAVIATGSNNSFRYFQHYFKDIPHLLRKNRKSIAVLHGKESAKELEAIADDIFDYYGLGCRNISLLLIPQGFPIERVIDAFEKHAAVKDHNKYANNYSYHKALFLMNQQEHLDNGFVLIKRERSLNAPLGCIYYDHYQSKQELKTYLSTVKKETQMVAGAAELGATVGYGQGQNPGLHDFADDINSFSFLAEL